MQCHRPKCATNWFKARLLYNIKSFLPAILIIPRFNAIHDHLHVNISQRPAKDLSALPRAYRGYKSNLIAFFKNQVGSFSGRGHVDIIHVHGHKTR